MKMSERKVINAEQFKNKATRIIEIDGFEEGEKICVRVKPVSLMTMMVKGKLPNELKAQVVSLFNTANKGNNVDLDSVEQIELMQNLMDKVCEECLVEPRFEEIEEFLTDVQKTQIFTQAQGNIKQMIPNNKE